MRILVVHQDQGTRGRLIRVARSLQRSDVAVTASPREALERVRNWQPDIVLMSASMAERYISQTLPDEAAAPTDGRASALNDDSARSAPGAGRSLRWDRGHAAHELAGILVTMAEDAPDSPRPNRSPGSRPRPPAAPSSGQLNGVERDILAAVANGSTTTDLAAEYGVTVDVIDGHVADVVAKLHRLEDAP